MICWQTEATVNWNLYLCLDVLDRGHIALLYTCSEILLYFVLHIVKYATGRQTWLHAMTGTFLADLLWCKVYPIPVSTSNNRSVVTVYIHWKLCCLMQKNQEASISLSLSSCRLGHASTKVDKLTFGLQR